VSLSPRIFNFFQRVSKHLLKEVKAFDAIIRGVIDVNYMNTIVMFETLSITW